MSPESMAELERQLQQNRAHQMIEQGFPDMVTPRPPGSKTKPRRRLDFPQQKKTKKAPFDLRIVPKKKKKKGLNLLNKNLTLRALVNKLPFAGRPLGALMGRDGRLSPQATLQSVVSKIPQAKLRLLTGQR